MKTRGDNYNPMYSYVFFFNLNYWTIHLIDEILCLNNLLIELSKIKRVPERHYLSAFSCLRKANHCMSKVELH